jgi:hypothetical protein
MVSIVNRNNFVRSIPRVPVLVLLQHQVTFLVLFVCCCRYIAKESSLQSHFRYHVLVLLARLFLRQTPLILIRYIGIDDMERRYHAK